MSSSEFLTSSKTKFSETLDRRTSLYSLVAAAAGVSMLALAQPAESEVVITKKTIQIPVTQDGQTLVPISLNNNGVNDFSFSLYSFAYHAASRSLRIVPLEGGAVVAYPGVSFETSARPLARGAKIGPSAHFSAGKGAFIEGSHAVFGYTSGGKSYYNKSFFGRWGANTKNRYLGVRFLINGITHYGWIRLTVTTASRQPISATITAYAYETVANKRIFAGEATTTNAQAQEGTEELGRASLGMLALGAEGLALWRHEEITSVH